jgi:hypothetical protein
MSALISAAHDDDREHDGEYRPERTDDDERTPRAVRTIDGPVE